MPRLQIVNNASKDLSAYQNLLHYVARPDKCICGLYGMTNLYLDPMEPPEQAVDAYYMALRAYHGKTSERYALHFIVEFAPSEAKYLNPQMVLELGYRFAMRSFPNLVCYFSVHDHACYASTPDQISYHIDMMVCTVDIYSGLIYHCGRGGGYKLLYDFIKELERYVPAADIQKPVVKFGRT